MTTNTNPKKRLRFLVSHKVPEGVEAVIAKVRLMDDAVEWRAACDQCMDELREYLDYMFYEQEEEDGDI